MKLSFIALICLCCLQTFAQKFHVSLSESKAGYASYSTLTAPGGELVGIRKEEKNNGNGSLMGVLPLALWHQGTNEELVKDAFDQSAVTHGHLRSKLCCALYSS